MEKKQRGSLSFAPAHGGLAGVWLIRDQPVDGGVFHDRVNLTLDDLEWLIDCAQECLDEWQPTTMEPDA